MKSFESGVLEHQAIPAPLVRTIRLAGEHRGRQETADRRLPKALATLREAAVLRSVECSCRLDGVMARRERIRELLAGRAEPANRSEQEILGYRNALASVATGVPASEFTPRVVLALHARLFELVPERGGDWKASDNLVTETLADGSTAVRFTPVPAYAVEDAINRLHEGFAAAWRAGVIDQLLLVASYLFDFLCIHPFSEGNGRMMRLLAALLLRRAGYKVTEFVSLDPLFDSTREACSEALRASWRGWHQGKHDLAPWWGYFLDLLVRACEELDREVATQVVPRGAKRDMVADAVRRLPLEFRHVDVERLVPGVSRPTINRALARLRASREIRCVKPGRNAHWQRQER